MDTFPPTQFTWDGIAMVPLHPRRADKQFVVGQGYTLVQHEERSSASHRHEFAWLHEAWLSLPEDQAERFPTSEHLRKWALIRAGYSHTHSLVCATKAEALRVAAYIRPLDEYAVVVVNGPVVNRHTAMSQSRRAMGAKEFQASKTAIMDIVAGLLGVTAQELPQARAA
jgi:hypothetical protein